MRCCCQTALIRVMGAALSYCHFWLPGLVHNFLFKVLEDFWAPVIRDSFKIISISFFLYFCTSFVSLTVMVGMEVAVQHSGRRESKDLCQTFLLGISSGCLCWCTAVSGN